MRDIQAEAEKYCEDEKRPRDPDLIAAFYAGAGYVPQSNDELRDEIAVDAMHATLSNPEAIQTLTKEYHGNLPDAWSLLARNCYAIADAMMEARKKE